MSGWLFLAVLAVAWGSLFSQVFDRNQDGSLDDLELRYSGCRMLQAHKKCMHSISDEQLSILKKRLDVDNSGLIERSEFQETITSPILGSPQQVHLATTTDPTEMVVMWVTRHADDTFVQYGFSSSPYPNQTQGTRHTYNVGLDGWTGWIHVATLKDLKTSTKYLYRVGQNDNWSSDFSFATPPGPKDTNFYDNTFAVVADMGTAIPVGWAVTDQIEEDMAQDPIAMVIHAGDVCYAGTGSTDELEEVWDVYGDQIQKVAAYVPWMFAVGNHEHYYEYASFLNRYQMPSNQSGGFKNFWWSMDYGNTHFTYISTEHPYGPGSDQQKWILQDLAKSEKNPLTKWRVMIGHRPMYSSDTDEWNDHRPGAPFQKQMEPIMVQYKIDLYLCGHMHMYERTFPVINGVPTISSGHVFTNPNATVHVNQATAGVFLDNSFVDPQPAWSAKRTNKWGYGKLKVNQTHIHYTFVRLWEDETGDEFWIQK